NECGSRRTRRRRAASQRLWRFLPRFYLPTKLARAGTSWTRCNGRATGAPRAGYSMPPVLQATRPFIDPLQLKSNWCPEQRVPPAPAIQSMQRSSAHLRLRFDQFHIQSQALEFLDQDVERFRESGLKERFPLDDRLVHSRTSRDIVRLDGQELLQGRGSAVGLKRPDFHFSQSLTAELGFPAQRLLRDQ